MSNFDESLFQDNDLPFILDLCRWLAAQLVVIGHCFAQYSVFTYLLYPHLPAMQYMGVLIFFFLSGFLISYVVKLKSPQTDYTFKVFFVDRFARIYSGLIPALLFILIMDSAYLHFINRSYSFDILESFDVPAFFANLLMLQNYPITEYLHKLTGIAALHNEPFGSGRPLWTLPIEWWLYMLFGWTWFKYSKELRGTRLVMFFVILAFFAVVPLEQLIHGKGSGVLTYAWLMGVLMMFLLAYTHRDSLPPRIALPASFAFLILALWYLKTFASNNVYNVRVIFLIGWSFFFFIAMFRSTNFVPQTVKKIVRFLADYSYSLYLIHLTVAVWFTAWEQTVAKEWLAIGGIIAANLVSMIFALFTEMQHPRVNRWIRKRLGIAKKRVSMRPSQA